MYYGDLYLGPAQTTTAVNLTAGVNNLQLAGRLLPYTSDPAALQQLSTLFSRYLNGEVTPVEARGATVALPSGQTLSWLTAGISALTLKVPLQSPTGRISPITGITIEQLSLMFDPNSAYAPLANSSEVSASIGPSLTVGSCSPHILCPGNFRTSIWLLSGYCPTRELFPDCAESHSRCVLVGATRHV